MSNLLLALLSAEEKDIRVALLPLAIPFFFAIACYLWWLNWYVQQGQKDLIKHPILLVSSTYTPQPGDKYIVFDKIPLDRRGELLLLVETG